MKTPREILLERHQVVRLKLDAIRHTVVGKLNNKGTKEQNQGLNLVSLFLRCGENIWRELVLPSRRIWAGLAATWLLIAVFNLSMNRSSHVRLAASSPSLEMIQAYRQQERLLAELIGGNEPRVADARRKFMPQPRSG